MREIKPVGILVVLSVLSGCAQIVSGDTQDVAVATVPRDKAQCAVKNGRGAWAVLETPSLVTLLRSTTPLTVACRTEDGWTGAATVDSKIGYLTYADAVLGGVGAAVDAESGAAFDYPSQVTVGLQPPDESHKKGVAFGAGGGRGIALPPESAADLARVGDDNIATRFQTLRVLLDEGLITGEEYNGRRGANLGALLRYSIQPPARDLGRPAPPPEQLVARLRYLATAYAEHSISAAEQAAERTTILEGLLPLHAIRRADPPPPIRDQLQLASEVGRVERMQVARVITEKESASEKAKITQLLDASIAADDAAARAAAGVAVSALTLVPSGGIGVALSTHGTEALARRAWAGLQKVYPDELGSLPMRLKKIPQPHRPSHYQIQVGPLANAVAATDLCRLIKHRGVACQATTLTAE